MWVGHMQSFKDAREKDDSLEVGILNPDSLELFKLSAGFGLVSFTIMWSSSLKSLFSLSLPFPLPFSIGTHMDSHTQAHTPPYWLCFSGGP